MVDMDRKRTLFIEMYRKLTPLVVMIIHNYRWLPFMSAIATRPTIGQIFPRGNLKPKYVVCGNFRTFKKKLLKFLMLNYGTVYMSNIILLRGEKHSAICDVCLSVFEQSYMDA